MYHHDGGPRHDSYQCWIDYIRVIACFVVVLAHCCDPFVGQLDAKYSDFLAGSMWGSFTRPCVPLFVMISGVLLMPVEMPIEKFYRRRLSRILYPLMVWSVITPILYVIYVATTDSALSPDDFTWGLAFNKIIFTPINFNYDTTPLWYLYMLVGIYLIMPLISDWLRNASAKSLRTFLYIWGVTLFLPYIKFFAPYIGYKGVFGNMGILGECDWNAFGAFYYFSGFLGYVVLAYYLIKYPLQWSLRRTLAVFLPLWGLGYAITFVGFIAIQKQFPDPATVYPYLELVWYFTGVNVFMMTVSAFVIMQKIAWKQSKFISMLATLTFGIYLSHFLVVQTSYDMLYSLGIPPVAKIPLMALCAFAFTAAVVYLLKKLPQSKYIVG